MFPTSLVYISLHNPRKEQKKLVILNKYMSTDGKVYTMENPAMLGKACGPCLSLGN
jgi:hypothetical protein